MGRTSWVQLGDFSFLHNCVRQCLCCLCLICLFSLAPTHTAQVLCDVPLISVVHRLGDCLVQHGDGVLAVTLLTHLAQAAAKTHHEVVRVAEEIAKVRAATEVQTKTPANKPGSSRGLRTLVSPPPARHDTSGLKERADTLARLVELVAAKPEPPTPVFTTPVRPVQPPTPATPPVSAAPTVNTSAKRQNSRGFLFGSPSFRKGSQQDLLASVAEETPQPAPPSSSRPPLSRPGRPSLRPMALFVPEGDVVVAAPTPRQTQAKPAGPKAVLDLQTGVMLRLEEVLSAILCQRGRLLGCCASDPKSCTAVESVLCGDLSMMEVLLPSDVSGGVGPSKPNAASRGMPTPPTNPSPKRVAPALTRRPTGVGSTVGFTATAWTPAAVATEMRRLLDEEKCLLLAATELNIAVSIQYDEPLFKLYRYSPLSSFSWSFD